MVEAIEDLFIPVLVYNNKKSDEALLKQFKEPSWNNPVTRFLDSENKDIIARKDRVWQMKDMAARMVAALNAGKREVPKYLADLAGQPAKTEKATFAMHCYWEGEGKLGSIPGVINTHSAWVDKYEVVEVTYDPTKVKYAKLLDVAQSFQCASIVYAHSEKQLEVAKHAVGSRAKTAKASRPAKLSDQKYYLRQTPGVRSLPLTQLQSTKVNAALMKKSGVKDSLSPRQIELFYEIRKFMEKNGAKSLDAFVFPDDDSKLADYESKLVKRLRALTESSQQNGS